jgi:diguanylate cyclase (GGDEF)-like protein/PAS domain S-box-containing protein
MTGISMDVDERKHAEERLHLQAAALESAANSILVSDREGTILWVNRAFSDLTGYAAEEVRGRNPRLLMSGKQSKEFYAKLWQTISTGNIWHGEFTNRRKDGSLYEEEQTITPVRSGRGDITHFVAVKQDITERKRSEETLKNSENKYRALFEDSADANWLMNEEGFLDCNSAALQMFGYSAGDRMLLHPADISPPNQPDGTPSRTAADQKIAAAFLNGKERFEWLHQRKNGAVFPSEVCLTALTLSGRPTLLATVRDITERKHAEEGLLFKTALLEAQAETTLDGILAVDESDHIVLANKQFGLHLEIPFELLSTRDDRIVLKHLTDKVEAPDAFIERVKYLNSHRDEKSRDELRFKNGKIFDRYSAPLVDSKRRYRGRIWYFRDITARKLAEERVQFLAYYDALTGLPNRTLLQDRLGKALAGARRRKDKVAILFFDLDRFKDINDSLGHSVGDILLQEVAGRLKTWAREQDTVARVGGDEFLIVLTGLTDVADAAVATERIVNLMTVGFVVQGHPVNVSCSIGVSIFPEHGADVETLIKNADAALYSAKENGRNRFRFFTEDMNAQAVERLTLENSLRLALAQKELFLMYQPQMDIATGRITGLEALLRWQHPDLGLVPPDKFIRIAENSGLIVPIGEWVLRTACSQARKWQDEGVTAVSVAVNVSAVQFRQEGFCEVIRRVLHETGLAPQYLELELTESLLLANADLMLSVVQELKAMGVSLAIDDFGTGYSSFSYLRQFRVSKLKIDRVFIRDVAVNPDDAAITTAIISMAKSLHLKVIAEGVEEEAQMSFLRAHQCDEIQGFYFSKPLVVDKASEKLRGNSPKPQVRAQASGKQS